MNMTLELRVTPRAYKAGEHLAFEESLADGTCKRCPGKWQVVARTDAPSVGMIRVYRFELEPLDRVARATAANQVL